MDGLLKGLGGTVAKGLQGIARDGLFTAEVLASETKKAGHSKRDEYNSTWIHVNTEGCKACLVEAWTTTNDDVYYKVYKMI